ncbi:MAG: hypothetical protein Fur0012_02660 [Elusimicrobiota bacterium]
MGEKSEIIIEKDEKLEAMAPVISRIAHDYNNFLAAVEGYAELLLRDLPPYSQNAQDVQEIKLSCEKMAATNKKLLAFARRKEPPVEKINLSELLEENCAVFSKNCGKSSLNLKAENVFLEGNREQVRDLISILLSCACKDGAEGSSITLGCCYESKMPCIYVEKSQAWLNGDINRLFYPYEPQDQGLDLAMAYGIVARHNAYFKIISEKNGATGIRVIFRGKNG